MDNLNAHTEDEMGRYYLVLQNPTLLLDFLSSFLAQKPMRHSLYLYH
jgi:hypothetical protein